MRQHRVDARLRNVDVGPITHSRPGREGRLKVLSVVRLDKPSRMIDLKLLSDARRLDVISQRVGVVLWKLQELEGIVATYLVFSTRAQRGMGEAAGNTLLVEALSKPFGWTVKDLKKAGRLPAELHQTVDEVLELRNWLVHRSHHDSRSAVRRDDHCIELLDKIESINDKARVLILAFGQLVENFARSQGISQEFVDAETARILHEWHTVEPRPAT
jgi:hypothetical protein